MKTFANAFIIIILVTIIYIYLESRTYEVVFVKSKVNDKEYLVRNLPDKQQTADLLAKMSLKLEKLVMHIEQSNNANLFKKYAKEEDNTTEQKLKEDLNRLINNFNPENLSESTPDAKYTSYSVNKGEKIVFCMRSKDSDERIVKENTMLFVAIHELGHLMTKSVGHTPEFWDNFKLLLKIAIDLKIYQHINFNKNPEKYCGTNITDTPYKP